MNISHISPEAIRELQKKLEKKLKENEISVIQYWKEQLDKVIALKPEGIAALQLELKKISSKMENRINSVKKS